MRRHYAAVLVLAVPVAAYTPTSNYIRLRRTPNALELQTCDVTLDLVADSRGDGAAAAKFLAAALWHVCDDVVGHHYGHGHWL